MPEIFQSDKDRVGPEAKKNAASFPALTADAILPAGTLQKIRTK